jgi:uncharacterized protein YbaR (Trm112 family)
MPRLYARDFRLKRYNSCLMLSQELLNLIRCPACKGTLDYSEAKQTLRCATCPRTYPIRDGIPVLLVDQSVKE